MVKPILFKTDMVRAILDGRKTITRRIVNPRYKKDEGGFRVHRNVKTGERWFEKIDLDGWDFDPPRYLSPPCRPGDILWVRETWNFGYFDASDAELDNSAWFEPLPLDYERNSYIGAQAGYIYRADFSRAEEYEFGTMDESNNPKPMPWCPSIHMPREAARIWLLVTDVRVERLQELTVRGLIGEGVCDYNDIPYTAGNRFDDFKELWDGTIKPADRDRYGWKANPFCWVISFERIDKEEAMQKVWR